MYVSIVNPLVKGSRDPPEGIPSILVYERIFKQGGSWFRARGRIIPLSINNKPVRGKFEISAFRPVAM